MSDKSNVACPTCGGPRPVSPPIKSVRTYFPFPDGQPEGWPEEYVALADYDRLRGALAVVLDEIHGGDLQYAAAFARKALGEK